MMMTEPTPSIFKFFLQLTTFPSFVILLILFATFITPYTIDFPQFYAIFSQHTKNKVQGIPQRQVRGRDRNQEEISIQFRMSKKKSQ